MTMDNQTDEDAANVTTGIGVAGPQAYQYWLSILGACTLQAQAGRSMTEEQAELLRQNLLVMLIDASDVKTGFAMPSEVLLLMHRELEAVFMGFEPEFFIPEARAASQKLAAPQIQRYIQEGVAWIQSAESRGEPLSEARAFVRDVFAVSKSTVSDWEARYPEIKDGICTKGLVRSAGRLYQKASTT